VSEKLDAQSRRVRAATTNVQNAISYLQTADGFMSGMTKVLSRMSELALLGKDVTKSPTDKDLYSQEFRALQDQLRATIGGTDAEIGGGGVDAPLGMFNGITLFGSGDLTVTIGQAVGQEMTIPATNLRDSAKAMHDIIFQSGSPAAYELELQDPDAVAKITEAIQHVATERASLGASQSRLELASTTLSVENEYLASAISRIRDVDVAEESTQLARYNVLVQSGTAMLAQANQSPLSVLKLLQS
jgi:flagellin